MKNDEKWDEKRNNLSFLVELWCVCVGFPHTSSKQKITKSQVRPTPRYSAKNNQPAMPSMHIFWYLFTFRKHSPREPAQIARNYEQVTHPNPREIPTRENATQN